MASKQDYFLTKAAKRLADDLKKTSDLNLRQIVSAGVVAFYELDLQAKMQAVAKAQMGDLLFEKPKTLENAAPEQVCDDLNKKLKCSGNADVKFQLLSPEEQEAVNRLRQQRAADREAAQLVAAAETEAAEARRQQKPGRKNTGS